MTTSNGQTEFVLTKSHPFAAIGAHWPEPSIFDENTLFDLDQALQRWWQPPVPFPGASGRVWWHTSRT
jgi:hypothetical protein